MKHDISEEDLSWGEMETPDKETKKSRGNSRVTVEAVDETEVDLLEIHEPVKKTVAYVDNERLTQEMLAWHIKVKAAKAEGKPIPQMPRFVAESVMKIAENLTNKHSYSGYSWKEEMIGDAIENCVRYLHNYDPTANTRSKKPNPFGYISLIVDRSFKGRIDYEKKQIYFKDKSFELMGGMDIISEEDFAEMSDGDACRNALTDMITRAHEYEANMAKRRQAEKEAAAPKPTTHHSVLSFL